jgi:hypothetical protein
MSVPSEWENGISSLCAEMKKWKNFEIDFGTITFYEVFRILQIRKEEYTKVGPLFLDFLRDFMKEEKKKTSGSWEQHLQELATEDDLWKIFQKKYHYRISVEEYGWEFFFTNVMKRKCMEIIWTNFLSSVDEKGNPSSIVIQSYTWTTEFTHLMIPVAFKRLVLELTKIKSQNLMELVDRMIQWLILWIENRKRDKEDSFFSSENQRISEQTLHMILIMLSIIERLY